MSDLAQYVEVCVVRKAEEVNSYLGMGWELIAVDLGKRKIVHHEDGKPSYDFEVTYTTFIIGRPDADKAGA